MNYNKINKQQTGLPQFDEFDDCWSGDLDFDSVIGNVVEDGTYPFIVRDVKRGYYNGRKGSKIPPCKSVNVQIEVEVPNASNVLINDTLYLAKDYQWKTIKFFESIGRKQPKVPYKMQWDVVGCRGRCQISRYTSDGREHSTPFVRKYVMEDK